ncbi:MAG: hypothetical protein ACKD6N_05855 [Candidatus Bathyarchaeota archaeon]
MSDTAFNISLHEVSTFLIKRLQEGGMTKAILTGWMAHYNLVRPHLALGKNPPAKMAEIPIQNDWKTLSDKQPLNFITHHQKLNKTLF